MTTKFTEDHEYIRLEGATGIVGITNYAQDQLGDIVFVELPSGRQEAEEGRRGGSGRIREGRVRDLLARVRAPSPRSTPRSPASRA